MELKTTQKIKLWQKPLNMIALMHLSATEITHINIFKLILLLVYYKKHFTTSGQYTALAVISTIFLPLKLFITTSQFVLP